MCPYILSARKKEKKEGKKKRKKESKSIHGDDDVDE